MRRMRKKSGRSMVDFTTNLQATLDAVLDKTNPKSDEEKKHDGRSESTSDAGRSERRDG